MAGNLPVDESRFIGRRQELAAVRELRRSARLITLTGLGGVGKTRTALRAAAEAEAAEEFADGVWLVELSGLHDSTLLVHAVCAALRVTDQTTRPQEDVLADHLADRHLLLVLDTCEHLLDASAGLAVRLLRTAPRLRILATSRQPLAVDGEHTVPVEPLPVAGDAVALFAQRARAAQPAFRLTTGNRPTVEQICARLDGIPLAIELAAALLPTVTLDALLDGLGDRFQLLVADESDDAPPHAAATGTVAPPATGTRRSTRHSTLRTAIGWSHELCPPRERLLWARLSVFAGDFSRAAAGQVCGDDALPPATVDLLLDGLVEKSLLARAPGPDGERFRQLGTVRAYGAEWLRRLGQDELLRARHLAWCEALAEQGERDWFGRGQSEVFHATRREHAQLLAALDFGLATPGHEEAATRLAGTLWFYWIGCGLLGDGRHWLERALARDGVTGPARLKALWVNGYVATLQGDAAAAAPLLTECRAEALRTGDDRAYAYATHRLGCAALLRDDHAEAEVLFEAALERYADLAELDSNVLMARIELAMALAFQGDLEAAVSRCDEVRYICEVHGERWAKAYALYVLAFAAWASGRSDEAAELARESLVINHEFGDLVGVVLPIELIALLRAAGGHPRRAATLHGAAQRIWRRVGPQLFGSAYFNGPHETAAELARKALGPADYASALHGGTALSLDQAVDSALEAMYELL